MRGIGVGDDKEVLYKRKIECVFIGGLFLVNVRNGQSYCMALFLLICLGSGFIQGLSRLMRV